MPKYKKKIQVRRGHELRKLLNQKKSGNNPDEPMADQPTSPEKDSHAFGDHLPAKISQPQADKYALAKRAAEALLTSQNGTEDSSDSLPEPAGPSQAVDTPIPPRQYGAARRRIADALVPGALPEPPGRPPLPPVLLEVDYEASNPLPPTEPSQSSHQQQIYVTDVDYEASNPLPPTEPSQSSHQQQIYVTDVDYEASNPLPPTEPSQSSHQQQIYVTDIEREKKKPKQKRVKVSLLQCSICLRKINGKRFKCLQCPSVMVCSGCDRKKLHESHTMLRIPSTNAFEKLKHLLEAMQNDVAAALAASRPPGRPAHRQGAAPGVATTTTTQPKRTNPIDDAPSLLVPNNSTSKYIAVKVATTPVASTIPEKPKPFEHPSGRIFRGRKRSAVENKKDKSKDKTDTSQEQDVNVEPLIYNPVPFQPVVDLFANIKPDPDPLFGADAAPKPMDVDGQASQHIGRPALGITSSGLGEASGEPVPAPAVEVKDEPQEIITLEEVHEYSATGATEDTNRPSEPYVFQLYRSQEPAPSVEFFGSHKPAPS